MAIAETLLSSLRTGLRAVPPFQAAMQTLRYFANADIRALRQMQRRHAHQILQPYPTTFQDRYPEVFTALSAHLWDIPEPVILSYGCSDGSEVRSLRRWFPRARIVGLDPNGQMIRQARAHLALHPDPNITYIEASSPTALGGLRFDAILAMAVFRHGRLEREAPESCTGTLPFARFASAISALDKHLRPGGWLSVWNAHFRFADTAIAHAYEPRSLTFSRDDPMTLLYGFDNRRIDGVRYSDVMFRKCGINSGRE